MAKVRLIAKMRKRSKTLPGDHFATVALAIAKGRFLGKKRSFMNPLNYQYKSCTYIKATKKEIALRLKNRAQFKIKTKSIKLTFVKN